jgi:hypothetical protein
LLSAIVISDSPISEFLFGFASDEFFIVSLTAISESKNFHLVVGLFSNEQLFNEFRSFVSSGILSDDFLVFGTLLRYCDIHLRFTPSSLF